MPAGCTTSTTNRPVGGSVSMTGFVGGASGLISTLTSIVRGSGIARPTQARIGRSFEFRGNERSARPWTSVATARRSNVHVRFLRSATGTPSTGLPWLFTTRTGTTGLRGADSFVIADDLSIVLSESPVSRFGSHTSSGAKIDTVITTMTARPRKRVGVAMACILGDISFSFERRRFMSLSSSFPRMTLLVSFVRNASLVARIDSDDLMRDAFHVDLDSRGTFEPTPSCDAISTIIFRLPSPRPHRSPFMSRTARTVVITGVSRGLGAAFADELIRRGHVVIGCARSESAVTAAAKRHGDPHRFDVVDVASDASVAEWAHDTLGTHGAPDFLINNASVITPNAPLWKQSATDVDNLFDINIGGTVNVIRHFLPAMIDAGCGVVVNFSSGWGRSTSPDVAPYCASKWAIEGLTQALAQELPFGLAAVALNPGIIDTAMLRSCFGDGAASYPDAAAWAGRAVDTVLAFGPKSNGHPASVT